MCAQHLTQLSMLEIPKEVVEFCKLSEKSRVMLGALDGRSILMHVISQGADAETRRLLARCSWKSSQLSPVFHDGHLYLLVPDELVSRYGLREKAVEFVVATPYRVGIVLSHG